ncbi:DUF805 domain-containing protein [Psychromicrobium sp. YIM B11713]|uniref:DUF805 domain-containing protein n=1 Tax=Psychromicrobium sp. YIM B11713 TaxID=3145233 RepID=UPI00374EF567
MSFSEAIRIVFKKYAEFNGRADRAEFWWWVLFNLLVLAALNLFAGLPLGESTNLGTLLASLWSIGVLLPSLAVTVRRLRDAGYHWKQVFWGLIPIAGIFIVLFFATQPTKDQRLTQLTE